jgi:hypothetical protein
MKFRYIIVCKIFQSVVKFKGRTQVSHIKHVPDNKIFYPFAIHLLCKSKKETIT